MVPIRTELLFQRIVGVGQICPRIAGKEATPITLGHFPKLPRRFAQQTRLLAAGTHLRQKRSVVAPHQKHIQTGAQAQQTPFVFTKVADTNTAITGSNTLFAGFNIPPSLREGTVAFQGFGFPSPQGVYLFFNGALRTIAETSTAIPRGRSGSMSHSMKPRSFA